MQLVVGPGSGKIGNAKSHPGCTIVWLDSISSCRMVGYNLNLVTSSWGWFTNSDFETHCDLPIVIIKIDVKAINAIATLQCEQSYRNAMDPFFSDVVIAVCERAL